MIVYSADKQQFLSDIDNRAIDDIVERAYRKITGMRVAPAEVRAWRESLPRIASILRDTGIPVDTGVAVEFHIPQSSKRIDVTLTGRGQGDTRNAVIIELKQWDSASLTTKDAVVTTYIGKGHREVVHPSYQAWSYATLLEGFNTAVYKGGIALKPCAYLHNYPRDGVIDDAHYAAYISKAPLFLKGEAESQKLRAFIKTHVHHGDSDRAIINDLERADIRPSKALADSLAKLMKGLPEFVLIDDQKTVYESALAAGQAAAADKPRVVIVRGGPGTGKTVVAINLLVELTRRGRVCKYVTKNAAPRAVFQAKLTGTMRKTRYDSMFVGSGTFIDADPGSMDVLIVDESHRLNAKSGIYSNKGENQIKELIEAAKCAVFFIDDQQRVTWKDIGTTSAIREFAEANDADIVELELKSQFRCGGSDDYLEWLDAALGIEIRESTSRKPEGFDIRVFDSPDELHRAIEERNAANKSRVVAGYCWDWASKKRPGAYDIQIGTYRRRWNLGSDGSAWIIAEASVSEVGCIHTCQGLEVEYVGVIIGPDLVSRNGRLQTVPGARSKHDQSLKGYKKLLKQDPAAAQRRADSIIRNTYRTLMSRGMLGCFIYCTDVETAEYFRNLLSAARA